MLASASRLLVPEAVCPAVRVSKIVKRIQKRSAGQRTTVDTTRLAAAVVLAALIFALRTATKRSFGIVLISWTGQDSAVRSALQHQGLIAAAVFICIG